jgi:hypothetical protein
MAISLEHSILLPLLRIGEVTDCISKHVFTAFTTKNGLKEENASSLSLLSFALEYTISEVEQHRVRTEWGTSAYGNGKKHKYRKEKHRDVFDVRMKVGLEVNAEKATYIFFFPASGVGLVPSVDAYVSLAYYVFPR